MKPVGHYYPVEWECGCPGLPHVEDGTAHFVFSCSSGYWYKKEGIPPFCPVAKHSRVTFEFDKEIGLRVKMGRLRR